MRNKLLVAVIALAGCVTVTGQETLPPVTKDNVPQTFNQLWAAYDPRAEPLDIEILKQWEEDEVVLRIVRYRIGIFKGQKAMMQVATPARLKAAAVRATLKPSLVIETFEGARETLRSNENGVRETGVLGDEWQGTEPEFRNLRWITE